MEGIKIQTARLILREYQADDLADIHTLMSDKSAMDYLQDIMTRSLTETQENLNQTLEEQGQEERARYFLWMVERESGRPVGSVGYTVTAFTPVGKLVHLGYFTYPHCWGRGYMTEAVQALLDYAFTQGGVARVSTGCLAENVGSERVMQKCGMVREAERPAYEWHRGALKTRLEYRLLRDEWFARTKSE